jgi:hypothetical protein
MDERLYVDNSSASCPAPFEGGTEEQPYCTITDAIDSIPYDPPGRAALIVQGTSNNYGDTRAITEGRVAAIIGRQGPRLTDDTGPSAFQGSRMYISGVELGSSMQSAVTCKSNSRLWIDDTAIYQNATGIIGDNCRRLVVRRSQIYRNLGDGIQLLNGGNFEMYASAVANNGDSELDTRGIRIGDTNFTIVASTIVENVSLETFEMSDAPTNLVCTTPTNGTIRNSIIGSRNGNTINCPFTTFGHSVVDTYTPTLPMDVLVFDRDGTAPFNPLWFVDVEGGEVRLKNPGSTPFVDVAQWELGDPRRDIEGTVRMPAPGDAEFAGADQP